MSIPHVRPVHPLANPNAPSVILSAPSVILSAAKNLTPMPIFQDRQYYVYILTNRSKTQVQNRCIPSYYVGVTNNLERRMFEHKTKLAPGFTNKYNLTRLAYYERTSDIESALAREKQIKGWLRIKKITLIESSNPQWKDLSLEWRPD